MELGQVGSMKELGITESFKLKKQVVVSASEAAEMILRVDNILRATPRRREGQCVGVRRGGRSRRRTKHACMYAYRAYTQWTQYGGDYY